MADVNFYKADLKEIEFALFEQFGLNDIFAAAPYDHLSEDEARMMIKEAYTFATEVLGPTMSSSDQEGCKLTPEGVKAPESFKEVWRQYYENGWNALALPEELGGVGAPRLLTTAVSEMLVGSNVSFNTYPGLSMAAAGVIRAFGTPEQRELYPPKIENGAWGGTMVLTEPHAGSDVGLSLTKATPAGDGAYKITGNKIFITGGDHDLAENIIHLALARIEGAPRGTRGLSLFIIPKIRVNPDGSLGEPNDVICTKVEEKMGIHASATAALSFGENGNCLGYLLGGEPPEGAQPGEGMRKMFMMMNGARVGVAIQSVALASTAYLNALDYARVRLQGPHITKGRGEKGAVPIIEHPDVRRMLLEMKAIVEGCRALLFHTVRLMDLASQTEDKDAREEQEDYFSLFIPLIKGHISDMTMRVTSTALQVYGGAGFTRDYPAEQYMRDARIFPIYEGTNGIQALDLVGRKLGLRQGAIVGRFGKDVHKTAKALRGLEDWAVEADNLDAALNQFNAVLGKFMEWGLGGAMEKVAAGATPFQDAMGRLTIAYLLAQGAILAQGKLAGVDADSSDAKFYQGKIAAARFYLRHMLPEATATLKVLEAGDTTMLDIPDEGFSLAF